MNRIQRWSTLLNIFTLILKFGIFHPNIKISFIVFFTVVWFVACSVSNRWSLSCRMILHTPMGAIQKPSDSGSRAPYPGAFILCVDGRDPMIHELWCHRIYGLCCEVRPTARTDTNIMVLTSSAIRSLEIFLSTAAFNSSEFLKFGEVVCHMLPIIGLQRLSEGGAALVPIIPLVDGVVSSTPFSITCCGVLFFPVLFEAAPATSYCTAADFIICVACTISVLIDNSGWFFVPILGSIRGGKKDTSSCLIRIVWLINFFVSNYVVGVSNFFLIASKIKLVHHSWLLHLPHIQCCLFSCSQLRWLARLNFIALNCKDRVQNLIWGLNTILNISAVTPLVSNIASFSSSIMNSNFSK